MKNALLWQITSPEGMKSFLFGTMHVRDLQAFTGMDQVFRCIDQSDRYYSEIEIGESGLEALSEFQQFPGGEDVTDLISGHQYERLRKSINRSFGMDIDRFRHFYPMIIANLIQTSILSQASDVIMDYHLYRYAGNQGKEMHFLESQMEQLRLFQSIPMDYQIRSLLGLGRQPAKAKKQILDLLGDYADKNTRLLYQRSRKQLGKLRQVLLYQRNLDMTDMLIKDLNTNSGFVGVGAAHLFGYKGILRLMKKSGFKIQPL